MMSYARKGAHAYSQVGVQTHALGATPHQLIVMLFDGARSALRKAQYAIANDQNDVKGQALSKAIEIIERGLRASLDIEKGGEIAERLDSLYDYMTRTLIRANRSRDPALVAQVEVLLEDIGSAWKQIDPASATVPAPPAAV